MRNIESLHSAQIEKKQSRFYEFLSKHSKKLEVLGLSGLLTLFAACEQGEKPVSEVYKYALENSARTISGKDVWRTGGPSVDLNDKEHLQVAHDRTIVSKRDGSQYYDIYARDTHDAAKKVEQFGIGWYPDVNGETIVHDVVIHEDDKDRYAKSHEKRSDKDPNTEESLELQSSVDVVRMLEKYTADGNQIFLDGLQITNMEDHWPVIRELEPVRSEVRLIGVPKESKSVKFGDLPQEFPSTPIMPVDSLENMTTYDDTLTLELDGSVMAERNQLTKKLAQLNKKFVFHDGVNGKNIHFGRDLISQVKEIPAEKGQRKVVIKRHSGWTHKK